MNELDVLTLRFIQLLSDNETFPRSPKTLPWLFLTAKSALINCGANHKDETGLVHLVAAPIRPTLGRRFFIQIDATIYPFPAQSVGETEHTIKVLRGVVTDRKSTRLNSSHL